MMVRVTAISPQKSKGYFNIFLDDKFAFSLSLTDLAANSLKAGDDLSEKEIQFFRRLSAVSKMTDRVLLYLARRPHSRFEIEAYLKRKFPQGELEDEGLVSGILDKLTRLGLIDDEEFARWLFEQRAKGSRAKGLRFIKSELHQRGISKETAEKIFSQKGSETDWKSLAAALVAKKMPSYKGLPIFSQRRKLIAFLLRRGFDYDKARPAVDEALKER